MKDNNEMFDSGLEDPAAAAPLGRPEITGEEKRTRGKGGLGKILVYGGIIVAVLFALGIIFMVVQLSKDLKGETQTKTQEDLYTVRSSGLKLPEIPAEPEIKPVVVAPEPQPAPQETVKAEEKRTELPKMRDLERLAFRDRPDLNTIKPKEKEKPLTRQEKILASPMMADAYKRQTAAARSSAAPRDRGARGNEPEFAADDSSVDYRHSAATDKSAYAENLVAVKTAPSSASIITPEERHLTIAKGTAMECVLNTKINTSVPGLVSCTLANNVYSMDGRVKLLDAGSVVTGEYTGAVANGLERIFVLWTEIITPDGVSLELNSPAAGALGEAGVGGQVDFHWWRRFGSALLFSLISDSFEYAINEAQSNTTNGDITYENTEDGMTAIIEEAMRQSGNIPPTLIKNQGETVMIMTARHMSFRDVYTLEAM